MSRRNLLIGGVLATGLIGLASTWHSDPPTPQPSIAAVTTTTSHLVTTTSSTPRPSAKPTPTRTSKPRSTHKVRNLISAPTSANPGVELGIQPGGWCDSKLIGISKKGRHYICISHHWRGKP